MREGEEEKERSEHLLAPEELCLEEEEPSIQTWGGVSWGRLLTASGRQ